MNLSPKYWVVIPAAGIGARSGLDYPKQYAHIDDKTVIEHTLSHFIDHQQIHRIVVVISEDDDRWGQLEIARHDKISAVIGGAERCQSVFNGLMSLVDEAQQDDWVFVHDAARPCLRDGVIAAMQAMLKTHLVGGALGLPCRDTLKRVNAKGDIAQTVDREGLWHVQTPQLFRFHKLFHALSSALRQNIMVTDESMAIELCGDMPLMIEGHIENIKITHPDDLRYARMYLSQAF